MGWNPRSVERTRGDEGLLSIKRVAIGKAEWRRMEWTGGLWGGHTWKLGVDGRVRSFFTCWCGGTKYLDALEIRFGPNKSTTIAI
jgi:hypothetical protein